MQAQRFFGWHVVAAVFTLAVFGWGLGFYGPPIVLHAVREARGWSLSLVSTALTVHFLFGALFVANLARLAHRFGMARLVQAGVVSMALGIVGWAIATAPWHLMAASIATAFGWAMMGAASVNALVSPWFVRKRPTALANAYNGASVGGIIFSPLLVWVIALLGLPAAMIVCGSVTVLVVAGLAHRYFSTSPGKLGLLVDGDVATAAAHVRSPVPDQAPPLRDGTLWRDRRFLLLAGGMSLGLFAQVGLIAHLFSLLVPALGAQNAGFVGGAATVAAILGRTLFGWLLSKGGDRACYAAASYAIQITGIVMLLASDGHSVPLLLSGVLLFGMGIGNATSLPPLIAQALFQSQDTARVVPMIVAISQATYAFAPAAFGILRELSASDGAPYLMLCAATLKALAILCLLASRTGLSDRSW